MWFEECFSLIYLWFWGVSSSQLLIAAFDKTLEETVYRPQCPSKHPLRQQCATGMARHEPWSHALEHAVPRQLRKKRKKRKVYAVRHHNGSLCTQRQPGVKTAYLPGQRGAPERPRSAAALPQSLYLQRIISKSVDKEQASCLATIQVSLSLDHATEGCQLVCPDYTVHFVHCTNQLVPYMPHAVCVVSRSFTESCHDTC